MIRIDEKHVVFPDSYGYTAAIDTHKTNKHGEPVYSNIGYYSSLPGAISSVFERKKRLALAGLLAFAQLRPDGIWEGD